MTKLPALRHETPGLPEPLITKAGTFATVELKYPFYGANLFPPVMR
jgi:hypothetical protein